MLDIWGVSLLDDSDRDERARETERAERERESARKREVEKERLFVARVIPERFSCVRLGWKLALHSLSCENSVVDHT